MEDDIPRSQIPGGNYVMVKCAGKLYTQLVPFLPPDEGTAACTDGRVRCLDGEIVPPSGVTTFQAHRGHYLRPT